MALKTAGGEDVVVAYSGANELTTTEWKQVLAIVGQGGLPLVVMALPGAGGEVDLEAISRKAAAKLELAVPVIPVDAGDVVAIYRVAQETLIRARAGGGAAVIQGVLCGTDAVKLMGTQLVRKGICTERWVERVPLHLNGLLSKF
jgi:TPP-dependent pyruvate/acetoin dehydrogenase alpha subunit